MIGATTLHGLLGQKSQGLGLGYLYNWYAASDANFAPTDWKMPTVAEYQILDTFLGTTTPAIAFDKLCFNDINNTYWSVGSPHNTSGFTGYGAGSRGSVFQYLTSQSWFWTSQSINFFRLWGANGGFEPDLASNMVGGSIRLLYTGAGTPTSVTDNDGNVYDVVLIGTQYWTVQNWKCTTLDNGTAIPNVTSATTWVGLTTGARCAYDNEESNV